MINELLTDLQKQQIVDTIKLKCQQFRSLEQQRQNVFYEPYTRMRQQYILTAAIISGFAPDRISIDGITSIDLNYGLKDKLVQPELRCQNVIFHIYSDGSDLQGNKIRERCAMYNTNCDAFPLFFIVQFSASRHGILKSVDMLLPNNHGKIVEKVNIYTIPNISVVSA